MPTPSFDSGSDSFAELAELVLERLRRGESFHLEALAAEHPQHAERIRQLAPLIVALEGDLTATVGFGVEASEGASGKAARLESFGDYELLEEIGRGGMGAVFKARQTSLNRLVALKVILDGRLASEDAKKRFAAEARAAASLDHPGIVSVYGFESIGDRSVLAMAYVAGESLAARVARGPLAPVAAAEMVRHIAQAIAYAHACNVIHRDLKPANVLVGGDGLPKVTDFGLAKQLGAQDELTITGQILGTPSFMAPEQAGQGDVGKPADIYALGAILYCLLTGRPPFQAASLMETLRQVREVEPAPPRLLSPAIPLDLQSICLKCLEKLPDRRYASASELANDLGRFLAGDRVEARSQAGGYVLRVWLRKHLRAAIAAIVLGGVFGAVFGLLSIGWLLSPDDVQLATELFREFPALGRPGFPWEHLASIHRKIPLAQSFAAGSALALAALGLPTLVALVRRLAKPPDIAADAASGALVGLAAGAVALGCGLGWAAYHRAAMKPMLEAARELRSLPAEALDQFGDFPTPEAEMLEHLAKHRPALRNVPQSQRAEVFVRQNAAAASAASARSSLQTVALALFCLPLVTTLQGVLLGQLTRRQQTLLDATGFNPQVRAIVDRHAVKKGRWRRFVGAPYYTISLAAAATLASAALLLGRAQAAWLGGPWFAAAILLLPATLAPLAIAVFRRTVTARRVFHLHLPLVEAHAEELARRDGENSSGGWQAVVCSRFADRPQAASVGFLFIDADRLRYEGRTLGGESGGEKDSLVFRRGQATVEMRRDWRTVRLDRAGVSAGPMRARRAFPGWLSFTIDRTADAADRERAGDRDDSDDRDESQRGERFSFYALPLLSFAPVEKSIFSLRPPHLEDGDDRIGDEELLRRIIVEPTTGDLLHAIKLAGDERADFNRFGTVTDRRTYEAYAAVRRVLDRTPRDIQPASLEDSTLKADGAMVAALPQPAHSSAAARRLVRVLTAIAMALALITIGAPLSIAAVGLWDAFWNRPNTKQVFDKYVVFSHADRTWTRLDLPARASAQRLDAIADRRVWRVRDGGGRILFDVEYLPGASGEWLAIEQRWRPYSLHSFTRERLLAGATVTRPTVTRPTVAERSFAKVEWPDETLLVDDLDENASQPAKTVEYFQTLGEAPVWMAFTIPLASAASGKAIDAEASARRMAASAAIVRAEQLSPEDLRRLPPSRWRRAVNYAIAAAAAFLALGMVFLAWCLMVLYVECLLVSRGKLLPEPCDTKAEATRLLEGARHDAALAKLGFAPAGHYRFERSDRFHVTLWKGVSCSAPGDTICYRRKPLGEESWCFLTRLEGGVWIQTCDRVLQILADPFPGRYSQSFEFATRDEIWRRHNAALGWWKEHVMSPSETSVLAHANASPSAAQLFAEFNVAQAQHFRRRPWRLLLAPAIELRRRKRLQDVSIQNQIDSGLSPPWRQPAAVGDAAVL